MINDFVGREDLPFFTTYGRFITADMYLRAGYQNTWATFDLFVRELPPNRNYLVFVGLEHVLQYLFDFRFTSAQLRYMKDYMKLPLDTIAYLKQLRFTGHIQAMPEGSIFFANEPVIRITAPIIQCAMFEQYLANTVMLQTMLASKMARLVQAARGVPISLTVIRTHGVDAAIKGMRAGYIVGCAKLASPILGMRLKMAPSGVITYHYFIQSFDEEERAFEVYARHYPGKGWMLVDTYDIAKGVQKIIAISRRLGARSFKGICIDSGDLAAHAKLARRMLDRAGLRHVEIMLMSNLEEYKIDKLMKQGTPVNWFGAATEVMTSADSPKLEIVYKLSEIIRDRQVIPKMKLSSQKLTYPGKKQVYRLEQNGQYLYDTIGLEQEAVRGTKLLLPFIKSGKLVRRVPTLNESAVRFKSQLIKFNPRLRSIGRPYRFPVKISRNLRALARKTKKLIHASS